jgi:hypothetical protein
LCDLFKIFWFKHYLDGWMCPIPLLKFARQSGDCIASRQFDPILVPAHRNCQRLGHLSKHGTVEALIFPLSPSISRFNCQAHLRGHRLPVLVDKVKKGSSHQTPKLAGSEKNMKVGVKLQDISTAMEVGAN